MKPPFHVISTNEWTQVIFITGNFQLTIHSAVGWLKCAKIRILLTSIFTFFWLHVRYNYKLVIVPTSNCVCLIIYSWPACQLSSLRFVFYCTNAVQSWLFGSDQWWANHKSNHMKYSQIQITWTQITNQSKSRCQPNENSYRLYSLCAKFHKCTSGLTVNDSAKIRDGNITEINSLTQLQ